MQIKMDTSQVDRYAEKLGTLHRSALPTAVRATLNGAAFEMKKNTLLSEASKAFTQRDRNFFKAFSRVDMAKGWDVDTMKATVGFMEKGLKGSNNYAVKNLEQQEEGGKIGGRSFIPMRTSRTGRSDRKKVKAGNRIEDIRNKRMTPINSRSGNRKQQFIKAAIYSLQHEDGLVLGHRASSGGRTLWRIESISQNTKSRKLHIKAVPIYNVKPNRSVSVKATNFVEKAAMKARKVMPEIFKHEAERQFKKHLG
jgi:hypothetical protein